MRRHHPFLILIPEEGDDLSRRCDRREESRQRARRQRPGTRAEAPFVLPGRRDAHRPLISAKNLLIVDLYARILPEGPAIIKALLFPLSCRPDANVGNFSAGKQRGSLIDPSLWEPVHAEPTQTTTDELELLRE